VSGKGSIERGEKKKRQGKGGDQLEFRVNEVELGMLRGRGNLVLTVRLPLPAFKGRKKRLQGGEAGDGGIGQDRLKERGEGPGGVQRGWDRAISERFWNFKRDRGV